jgi:uncharacterized protein YjbJ (UPF0337 family)
MNKDQVKGKAKEIIGAVEEQAGYWSDDKKVENKGVIMQADGKAQKAWGDVKEEIGNTAENIKKEIVNNVESIHADIAASVMRVKKKHQKSA